MGSGASNQVGSGDGSVVRIGSVTDCGSEESSIALPNTVDKKEKTRRNGPNRPLSAKNQSAAKNTEIVGSVPTTSKEQPHPAPGNTQRQDFMKKIKDLEHELAISESQKLDLQDQLQILEERCSAHVQQKPRLPPLIEKDEHCNETEHAKDHYIAKLEKDLQSTQTESNKLRIKLKKRIRALTNQLQEVRQEASIKQMEMRAEITQQNELIKKFTMAAVRPGGERDSQSVTMSHDTNHSKIIVELSNQMSEQGEKIASLESDVAKKDSRIEELEKALREKQGILTPENSLPAFTSSNEAVSTDHLLPTSVDRLPSGRGMRQSQSSFSNQVQSQSSKSKKQTNFASQRRNERPLPRPSLERQSTALSDSDSDWELDSTPSHIHSAPARSRVKSAAVEPGPGRSINKRTSLQGDDDSIMNELDSIGTITPTSSDHRVRSHKKSALRHKLEQVKKEQESSALMGPTLAFAAKSKDPISDTSCEPTPRYKDPSKLPGFSKLKIVNPVAY